MASIVALTSAWPSTSLAERRVAVLVGHDDGGPGTRPLRFAVSDAERMHALLTTVGGVSPDDATLLRGPTPDEVLAAIDAAERKARGGLLVFYYSGHAKDGALRLGQGTLELAALRTRLDTFDATTRVAVLDACQSGAIVRKKGARRVPAFDVRLERQTPRGVAVLASSAADEESQESDLLGGSFFTHHLASGLLGDADADADGQVTLQEAYAHAYTRTVAATTEAAAGLQHPTFDYDLKGAGALWLSRPATSTSAILLPEPVSGEFVVVDARRRVLVAEIAKSAGVPRRIPLPPGRYEVRRRDGGEVLVARVLLESGDTPTLDPGSMRRVALGGGASKGDLDWAGELAALRPVRLSIGTSAAVQGFLSQATRDALWPTLPTAALELEVRDAFDPRTVLAFDVAGGGAPLTAQLGGLAVGTAVGQGALGFTWLQEFDLGRWTPSLGLRASLLGARRTFDADVFRPQSLLTLAPGLVAGLSYELVPGVSIGMRARASYVLYFNDEDLSLGFADLGATFRWELP